MLVLVTRPEQNMVNLAELRTLLEEPVQTGRRRVSSEIEVTYLVVFFMGQATAGQGAGDTALPLLPCQ